LIAQNSGPQTHTKAIFRPYKGLPQAIRNKKNEGIPENGFRMPKPFPGFPTFYFPTYILV